ncbi:MAG: nitronate monooxygenase [Gammaproteobacteria bacterium]
MWTDRRLLDLFGIEHPIIQAPMAGSTNPELVAAVSASGALGSFGAASSPPDKLRTVVQAIQQRTSNPYNINLFAASTEQFDRNARPGPGLAQKLQNYHDELALGPVPEPGPLFGPAEAQLDVLLEQRVPVISIHFGVDSATVERAKSAGAKVLCSATTVAEARQLEAAGVDAIIAQGAYVAVIVAPLPVTTAS